MHFCWMHAENAQIELKMLHLKGSSDWIYILWPFNLITSYKIV